jgi:hypothetical protein
METMIRLSGRHGESWLVKMISDKMGDSEEEGLYAFEIASTPHLGDQERGAQPSTLGATPT